MTPFTSSPVRLAGYDTEGLLLFSGPTLVAIIAKLSAIHGEEEGRWHIEYTGSSRSLSRLAFRSLDEASDWLAENAAV